MSKEALTYHLITNYLNGSLTKKELLEVESRIEKSANFRNYLEAHKQANQVIVLNEETKIKNTLAAIHSKAVLRNKMIKYGLITIVLLLSISVFVVLNIDNGNSSVLNDTKKEVKTSERVGIIDSLYVNKKELKEPVTELINNEIIKENKEGGETISIKEIFEDLDSIENNEIDVFIVNDTLNLKLNEESRSSLAEDTITLDEYKASVHNCDVYEADIVLETFSTCNNKSEGVLNIKTDKDGYSYSMDGGFTIQNELVFSKLRSGKYNLLVFDKKKCKSEPVSFEIISEECDFMIQPSRSIYWEIKVEEFKEDKIKLEIYSDKSGQKVFEKNLQVFEANTWKGETNNGESLTMGSYVYILSSSNKTKRGNVTIVQ